MKTANGNDLITYIETPRRNCAPIEIDSILEARMKAFLRAKSMNRWITAK